MDPEVRKILASKPIEWIGDLTDDCSAKWAGLFLRAEWMGGSVWWWAVYDLERNKLTIDSSNNYNEQCIGGEAARKNAEKAGRGYIGMKNK